VPYTGKLRLCLFGQLYVHALTQGDHLSLFLVNPVEDALEHTLFKVKQEGILKGVVPHLI
jgi:hypothetical protein